MIRNEAATRKRACLAHGPDRVCRAADACGLSAAVAAGQELDPTASSRVPGAPARGVLATICRGPLLLSPADSRGCGAPRESRTLGARPNRAGVSKATQVFHPAGLYPCRPVLPLFDGSGVRGARVGPQTPGTPLLAQTRRPTGAWRDGEGGIRTLEGGYYPRNDRAACACRFGSTMRPLSLCRGPGCCARVAWVWPGILLSRRSLATVGPRSARAPPCRSRRRSSGAPQGASGGPERISTRTPSVSNVTGCGYRRGAPPQPPPSPPLDSAESGSSKTSLGICSGAPSSPAQASHGRTCRYRPDEPKRTAHPMATSVSGAR